MPRIPNVQHAPIPVRASESVSLSDEPVLTLAKTEEPVVNSSPPISNATVTNDVTLTLEEPELNSPPSSPFIGSSASTLIDQTPSPANPVDAPILIEATPAISPAPDQSPNTPNEQPTLDVKSEATVGLSNVQNNTGTDWWSYWWVPVLVTGGIALGYGLYRLKKTQTQLPTPSSSTVAQGYARVNDPNGPATF